MRNICRLFVVLSVVLVAVCGCDGDDGDSVALPQPGDSKDLVGIPFRHGIECLGEEAQSIEGDTLYVSPDGDDDNLGNAPDVPLLSNCV